MRSGRKSGWRDGGSVRKKDGSAGNKGKAEHGTAEADEEIGTTTVGKRGRGRPPGSKGIKKRELIEAGNLKKMWGKMREEIEKPKGDGIETNTDEENEEGLLIDLTEEAFRKSDKIPDSPIRREVKRGGNIEGNKRQGEGQSPEEEGSVRGTRLRSEAEVFTSSTEKSTAQTSEEKEGNTEHGREHEQEEAEKMEQVSVTSKDYHGYKGGREKGENECNSHLIQNLFDE